MGRNLTIYLTLFLLLVDVEAKHVEEKNAGTTVYRTSKLLKNQAFKGHDEGEPEISKEFLDEITNVLQRERKSGRSRREVPAHTENNAQDDTRHLGHTNDHIKDHVEDGIRERIIDGIASRRHRWPWSVALDTEEYGFICAGTLIARQWVLTAAHCVYGAPVTIYARISAWNLTANDQKDTVPVQQMILHPGFNARTGSAYDVALLRLIREANVNSSDVLALPNLLFNLFELNPTCYIIGWGVTESGSQDLSTLLNQRWVNVISHVECQTRWNEAPTHPSVYPSNLCIDEGPDGDISACQGDSGSPLQCYDRSDGVWRMAGLSSWGSSACKTYPSVYVRIQSFLTWIFSVMADTGGTE